MKKKVITKEDYYIPGLIVILAIMIIVTWGMFFKAIYLNEFVRPKLLLDEPSEPVIQGNRAYQCSDGVIKISLLKRGDVFNGHKIKSAIVSCEENCQANSAKLQFEGEEFVLGTLENTSDWVYRFAFIPDDQKWLPTVVSNDQNNDFNKDATLKGISCDNLSNNSYQMFAFSNPSDGSEDFSVLASNYPDLMNFVSTSLPGDKYPKKVLVKVKNLVMNFSTGGESYNVADLVEIVKVID